MAMGQEVRAGEVTFWVEDAGAGARLQVFARSSHCPFWEEAGAFNAAVAAFAA
jgi:pimeloyl-ACP methyl ester carboxylesterase